MRIDKETTNAVTGHFLKSSSLMFDQVVAWCQKDTLNTENKQKLLNSIMMVFSLLSGIAMGTLVAEEIDLVTSAWTDYHPAFTFLGLVFAVLLFLHDYLLISKWHKHKKGERAKCTVQSGRMCGALPGASASAELK